MRMKCRIHNVLLICFCPACRGEATSKLKTQSSQENGKLGGRPRLPDRLLSPATLYRRRLKEQKQRQGKET